MKAVKNSLAGFILFVLIASGSMITCEIGLGNSVDTKPPTVGITYPPANSIIRGDFILAGTVQDETALDSVTLTLTNVETNTVVGTWNADIDREKNTWSYRVENSPLGEAGFSPISDGSYQLAVVAKDSANRTADKAQRYFIDNTAPLVVITRPSTNRNEVADPFGDSVTFSGSLWDNNNCSAITVNFYKADDAGGLELIATHTQQNVLANWEFTLPSTVFELLSAGMDVTSEPSEFYYTLTAYDDSFIYQSPSSGSPSEPTGNGTTRVYESSDLSAALKEGDTFTLKQLSELDSGKVSAVEGFSLDRTKLQALSLSSSECTTDGSGNFSIDPFNKNPTVEISGFTWYPLSTFTKGFFTNQIAGKSIVNVTVKMGKSNAPLRVANPPIYAYIRADDDDTRVPLDSEAVNVANITSSGSNKSFNFEIPKTSGSWVLIVQATDGAEYTTTRSDAKSTLYAGQKYGEFAFKINGSAPYIDTFSPDAKKVRPAADGNFILDIDAFDSDSSEIVLTVNRIEPDGSSVLVVSESKAGTASTTSSTGYTFDWSVSLPAAAEGETITYQYLLYDGKYYSTSITKTYETDTTVPVLRSLVSPILGGSTSVVVDGSGLMLKGYSDNDLASAMIAYTRAAETGAPSLADERWTVAQVSTDTGTGYTDGGGTYTKLFSGSLVLKDASGNDSEGDYRLWLRLADDTNVYGDIIFLCNVTVDKNPPVFTETVSGIGGSAIVYRNTNVSFGGSSTDSNGIKSVTVTYSKNGGSSVSLLNQITGASSWAANLGTVLGDGTYEVVFTATDKANKTTSFTRNVMIDTASPILSISYPASGEGVSTTSYTIRGSVDDGSGKGVSVIEYSLDSTNGTNGSWTAITRAASWSATGLDFSPGGEGSKTLWVRASDGLNAAVLKSANFQFDLNPPELAETTSGLTGSLVNSRTAVSFGGSASDTNQLSSVTVSINGGAPVAVTGTNSWNWTLPNTTDGTFALSFVATDAAQKTTTVSRNVLIDTTAPSLPAFTTTPGLYVTNSLAIAGTATDGGSGVQTAYYRVNGAAGDPATGTLTGTDNWFATLNIEDLDEGSHTVYVWTVDRAGNKSAESSQVFAVDRANPSFSTASPVSQSIRVDGLLSGTAADTRLMGTVTATVVKDGGATNFASVVTTSPDGKTRAWDISVPVSQGLGTYVYTIKAVDAVGRSAEITRTVIIDYEPPTISISNINADGSTLVQADTFNVTGVSSDVGLSGLNKVEYNLNGAGWVSTTGTDNWLVPLTGLTDRLNNTFAVRATDNAGNISGVTTYEFDVDLANPNFTETGSGIGGTASVARNSNVVFGGASTDGNGIKSVVVTYTKDSGTPVTLLNQTSGAGTWTATLGTALGDGTYELTFVATDNVNKKTEFTRTVVIDTASPVLAITSPAANEGVSITGYTIRGSVDDGSGWGVKTLEYSLDSTDGSDGSWTAITKAASWVSLGVNFSSGGEGAKTLWVRASDSLNPATVKSVTFQYDINPPELNETTSGLTGSLVNRRTAVAFGGNASDTNALLSVTVSVNGGTPVAVTGTAPWNWTLPNTTDGTYALSFVATDVAQKTTTITRNVLIDTTDPDIPEFSTTVAAYVTSSLAIAGTASDSGSGVQTAYYRVNGADGDPAGGTLTGTDNWFATLDVGFLDEGDHKVYVWTVDRAGNISSEAVQNFIVDEANPVFSTATPVSQSIRLDGLLSGSASDTRAMGTVTATVAKDGGEPTTATVVTTSPNGKTRTWSISVPVSLGLGTYVYTIKAVDAVGRSTEITRTVIIDNEPPTISIANIESDGSTLVQADTFNVTGLSSDVGLSGLSKVEYNLNGAGWVAATGTSNWLVPLTGLTDGLNRTFAVRATDNAGNISPVTSYEFDVDLANPTFTETTSGIGGTTVVYRNTDVVFSGASTDGNGIKSVVVTYSKNSGAPVTLLNQTSGAGTWTATLGTALGDGTYEMSFVATDNANKKFDFARNVVIDTTSPSLAITAPAVGEGVSTSSYTIRGTVDDGSGKGIDTIAYSLNYTNDGNDLNDTWVPITKAASWSATGVNFSSGGQGTKTFWVRASDGLNPVTIETVSFQYDTEDPAISETASGLGSTTFNTNDSVYFAGIASDSNALASVTVSVNGADPVATSGTAASWNWTSPAAEGEYSLQFIATDVAGRTKIVNRSILIDKTKPTVSVTTNLTGWKIGTIPIAGTVADTGGSNLSLVEYQLGSTAGIWMPASIGIGTWSGSLSLADSDEGNIPLFVRASDRAGNVENTTAIVKVDLANPVLSETAVNTTTAQHRTTDLTFGGEISDTNTSANPTMTVTINGGAPIAIPPTGTSWSYTYTVDGRPVGEDGSYTLVFAATDAANKTSTVTRTVMVDNTNPVVSMNAVGGYQSGTVSISGTFTETNLEKIEYQLDSTVGAWTLANASGMNWSGSVDFSEASEGSHTVYYRATDKAGNVSNGGVAQTVTVNVDRANPNATMTVSTTTLGLTDASLELRETDFMLSGVCDDAGKTDGRTATSVTLSATKDGASQGALTLTSGGAGSLTWTYNQAVNETTHAQDGLWVYTLTVTDVAGKTATATKTVRIDTTAPEITIGAPAAGVPVSTNLYTISGQSTDTGGSGFVYGETGTEYKDVEYSLNGTSWTTLNSLDETSAWKAADVMLGAEGSKTLYVRSTDRLGNVGTKSVNFYYDLADPVLEELADDPYFGVGTADTQYINSMISFAGTASDTNSLTSLVVRINGAEETIISVDSDGPDDVSGTADDNCWTYTFDSTARVNKTYTLVFIAKDAANQVTTVSRTVVVDKSIPTITAVTDLSSSWRNSSTATITGTASDIGSAIQYVKYRISADNGSTWGGWSNFTGTTSFTGTVNFEEGDDNKIQVVAVDRAGNESLVTEQTVKVDTFNPEITITSPVSIPIDNGSGSVSIEISASDTASGPKTVYAKVGSSIWGVDVATYPEYSTAIVGGVATLTITDLTHLPAGNQKIYLRADDNSGRYSVNISQTILIDKTDTVVTINAPGDGATVNKTISLSGTASDLNGVGTTGVFQIQRASDSLWVTAPSGVLTAGTSWTVSGFNTVPLTDGGIYDFDADANEISIKVRVGIKDAAGNTGYATRTLVVSQDSDRPVVKLSNVNNDGSTTLKMINEVYGTVSDDDGITLFEISEDGATWLNAGANPARVVVDGNSWTYISSTGDGSKTLWFRVTDSAGMVFTTNPANDDNTLAEPKVQYGLVFTSSSVTYKVDTVTPEVGSTIYADRSSTYDFGDKVALLNNMAFGGSSKVFAVGINATDANGIKSVSVAIPGVAGSPFAATGTFVNAPVVNAQDIRRGGQYMIESYVSTSYVSFGAVNNTIGTTFTATRDGTGADTGTVRTMLYATGQIDVTASADAYVQMAITVTDNSDLASSATRTVLIDNTVPSLTHQSPLHEATVNGDIEVKGLADDGLGSGLKTVKYQIGKNADLDPASASWLPVTAGTLSWRIDFKGADKIDNFAKAVYGTEGTGSDEGLWLVPIVMRLEDNAGNVEVSALNSYVLKIDPSGDKPKVAVVYPDPLTTNRVMGGIIRVFGTSYDDDAVKEVMMQIDTNNDGLFDTNDDGYGTPAVDWYNGGDGQLASGTISWNKSINENKEFDPATDAVTATAIRNGSVYKIVSVGTTDFTTLGAANNDVGTEFRATRAGLAGDGDGTVNELIRRITFRVRARDINDPPVDGSWMGPYVIDIDKNVPKIGSLTPLTMTQDSTEQLYQADMWVKGNWVLSGSVEDESGIAAITVTGDISGTMTTQPAWFVQAKDLGDGKYDYNLNIPINTVANNTDSIEFTITALDNNTPQLSSSTTIRINYDNEEPSITTLKNGSSVNITTDNPVVQSNNIFTIKSTVTEDGSGFERVAYYILRNVAGTDFDRVYNPMESKAGNANRTYLNTLTMVDGLPRLRITSASAGFSRPNEYSLTADIVKNNTNVRKGGLVKIGGLDRLITAVNRTTGTIQWAQALDTAIVATDGSTADIAYALVVDHQVVESPVWVGNVMTIPADDGDGVLESVERSGGLYTWESSFDSRNIPDGPIEIHWVAFDKAGNFIPGSVVTRVENNRPLLAAVTLGTDLDGSGTVTQSEKVPAYSALDGEGKKQSEATVASSSFIAKGLTSVDIDVVGGNGELRYVFTENSTEIHPLTTLRNPLPKMGVIDTGTDLIDSGGHGFTDGMIVYLEADVLPEDSLGGIVDSDNYYIRDVSAGSFRIARTYNGAAINFGTTGTNVSFRTLGTIDITKSQLVSMGEGSTSFVFKVWDSTEETTIGVDSLSCKLTVPLTIDVVDEISPVTVVDKFFWSSSLNNSLYENSKANGHIELEADLPNPPFLPSNTTGLFDRDPKVSGKISIRGSAYDEIRLSGLYLFLGDYEDLATTRSFMFTNAASTKNFGAQNRTYAQVASYSTTTGNWTGMDQWSAQGWKFTVTPDYLDQTGHRVTWQLDINTAKITNVAAIDRLIRVIAEDGRVDALENPTPNPSSEIPNPTAVVSTNNVPKYRMDVVPYISSISTPKRTTSGLKDTNLRSSDGKYSIITGTDITFGTVYGFNLNPNAVRIVDGTAVSGTVTTTTGINLPATGIDTTGYASFNITNASTKSGYLEVFTSGIRALNNINANNSKGGYAGTDPVSMYNREPDAVVRKNLILNDDRYIRFFTMVNTAIKNGYYPNMIMDTDNNPVFGLINPAGGTGTYFPNTYQPQRIKFNGTTGALISREELVGALAWEQMAMAKDAGGRYYHVSQYNYSGEPLNFIYDRYSALHTNRAWAGYTAYTDAPSNRSWQTDNNAICLETNALGSLLLDRYQYPKLVVKGDSVTSFAQIYLSYYDDNTGEIALRNFQIGTNAGGRTTRLYNGGGYTQWTNFTENTNGGSSTTWNSGRLQAATGASKYFDMGVTADNRIIIVYYDESQSKLVLRYSNTLVDGSTPLTAIAWTNSTATFPDYVGQYVSLAVDGSGGIHISSFDSSEADLKYMYLSSYNDTTLDTYTVDSAFSVGNWTKISVRNNIPYIAYYNSSEAGSRDAIKLAYSKNTIGSITTGIDANGFVTGSWEFMTVPTISPAQGGSPKFKQVNLDFDNTGRPVLGYLGTNIEFGGWVAE